jgi:nucleotide-binding universal stress UspA family protein
VTRTIDVGAAAAAPAAREADVSDCAGATHHAVLVPLDGSELSERALPFAVALAQQHGGALLLLEATDVHHPNDQADAYLGNWAERLVHGCGLRVVRDVVTGEAGHAIVDEAALHGVDLIVMATHARTGVERALKGSVADYVLHHASVPVLLVPAACDRSWGSVGAPCLRPPVAL